VTWTFRAGQFPRPAGFTMRRASHSREGRGPCPLITSFAITGNRDRAGRPPAAAPGRRAPPSCFPKPVFRRSLARKPSWNHDDAQTRFPPACGTGCPSIRTSTGPPAGDQQGGSPASRRHIPRSSGFQRATGEETVRHRFMGPQPGKSRPRPAIPHTVRFPGWERKPQASMVKRAERRGGEQRREHGQQRHQATAGTGQHGIREHQRESVLCGIRARPAAAAAGHHGTACRTHLTSRPGTPSPRGSPPHAARGWPHLGEPFIRYRGQYCYVRPRCCPAAPSPPRSCACDTRAPKTTGPSAPTRPSTGQYSESELPGSLRAGNRHAGTRDRRHLHPLRRPQHGELTTPHPDTRQKMRKVECSANLYKNASRFWSWFQATPSTCGGRAGESDTRPPRVPEAIHRGCFPSRPFPAPPTG